MKQAFFILILLITSMCNQSKQIDFQGHRGARGLLPENTLPAFQKALELGVSTLELDLSVSKEGSLIVSHEPWFNAEISTDPMGNPVMEENAMSLRIYDMSVSEIQTYDVGIRGNPRFKDQMPMAVYKPLFSEVVKLAEEWANAKDAPKVFYNIETKSMPEGDNIFHPEPAEFVEIIHKEISDLGIKKRVIVQSFDPRTLEEMHKLDAEVTLALLVEDATTLEDVLAQMTFVPDIFSPDYETLSKEVYSTAVGLNMRVIPWTVNEVEDMRRLLEMGVDGLISDYPDRYKLLK